MSSWRTRFRSGRCLASVVSVALIATSIAVITGSSPAIAAPAAAAANCVTEQRTALAAGRTAAACHRRVEILAERTEVSQTFVNGDGSQTLEVGVEPERVRKGSNWVPVDTSLKETDAGLEPRASVLPMVFSAGGDGPFARLRDGKRAIAVSWPGRLPKPVIVGDTAVYRDVLPDVDLRVTAEALGFSEVLVVRSRAATRNPKLASLRFGLRTEGVEVAAAPTGGLAARDAKGETVFTAPAPLMWDSSARTEPGAPPEESVEAVRPGVRSMTEAPADKGKAVPPGSGTPARKAAMKVRAVKDALIVTPDARLLADPGAQLPLYIDPSWTGSISSGAWTSVFSKLKGSSFWKNSSALNQGKTYGSAGAGRTKDCRGCSEYIIRSFFRMDVSKVRKKQIVSAMFRIEQKHAWTCSPKSNAKLWLTGGISDRTTWNNQPTWDSKFTSQTAANRKNGGVHGCSGAGTIEFNATSMVTKAAAGNWSTLTMGLRAVNEGTLNQWKRFNHSSPKLAITYNSTPNGVADRRSDGKSCAVGSARPYVLTQTPILAAKHSDPDTDQQNLSTHFYWWPLGGSRSETNKVTRSSGNPSATTVTIPSGRLADGGTYVWQARTYDGRLYGAWSGTCEFTVDATPPPAPGNITSTDYPADDAPHGGVGLNGTFRVVAPTTRPYEIKEYAWTLDSGVLTQAKNVPARTTDRGATITLPPLHDGRNTLRVWARDQAGRYSASPKLHTFLVRAGDGPAAEWSFDEESGAVSDTTTHGNTAALDGAAARVPGRGGVGYALSLNGSGSATKAGAVTTAHPDTGDAIPVRTDSTFTVSARVKLDSVGGTGKPTVVAANGTRASAFALAYSREDNRWRFHTVGADQDSPTLYSVLSDDAPIAGRWVHLAGVYQASTKTISMYVDGVLQTATRAVPATFNATAGVTIGKRRWNGGYDGWFVGAVDDVRIYNFAESASNLAKLAVPLPAAVSFPAGMDTTVGGKLTAGFGSGGDVNVVKFRYSVDTPNLSRAATATTAGGVVTVAIDVGSQTGDRMLYVAAVDSGNRVGPTMQYTFTVESAVVLSGTVLDGSTFMPVPGATVTLAPGGLTVQSDDDGSYRFTDFAPGPYTLSAAKGGKCGLSGSVELEIGEASLLWDLYVFPYSDDLGYTCRETSAALSAPSSTLSLSGDNAVAQVPLPFEFPFYGQSYSAAWVDTNGVVSFDDPAGSRATPDKSNAGVAPFWDDLVVDSSASVRTSASGTGSGAQFTIQWRNVHLKESASQRLSFETTLTADGDVSFTYDGLDNDAEKGAGAEVGIAATVGADGLSYSVAQPSLASGKSVVFTKPAAVSDLEQVDLSGRALTTAGTPMSGVTVTVDPSGRSATTGADGVWRFDDLVLDSYTVAASASGRCPQVAMQQVDLADDTVIDLRLGPDYGDLGYACSVGTANRQGGTTLLSGVTGDDASVQTTMPFPVVLHGVTYNRGWISTNGMIGFGDEQTGTRLAANPAMPSSAAPDAVVAPFWDDLEVDATAGVYTKLTGTAPNRTFVVEWRNAKFRPSGPDRVSFEVQFAENGQISFHYGTLTTPLQQGAAATVGLESASGTVAAQYLFQQAMLTSNSSITYIPAAVGAVEGTVTVAVTGAPAAGIPVTLNPGARTTTTGVDGTYQFPGLPVGEYTVAAATGDTRCAGQSAREFVARSAGNADVDLSVMSEGDEFGYRCTSGPVTWVPGDIVEDWTGDEATWQKNPPFPVKLYGESYTSAWINSNGLVTFKDPMYFGWIGSTPDTLPSDAAEGKPNAAVYGFWDDWIVDSSSRIATKSSGTAPNRQWVVEWRNVRLYNDATLRASFEIVFSENGQISLAYKDLPANALGRGSEATVGIENASGTIAFQYSSQQAVLGSGQGVVYRPSPPGQGSVSGTVTCGGVAVSGSSVTVAGLTAATAADGRYRIDAIPAGNYAVIATTPGGACAGSTVEQSVVGTSTQGVVDFLLANTEAGAGYTITEQPVAYTPANTTVLPITGDDAYTPVTLPFPVGHYGVQHSTAWVDSNGLIAFTDPGQSSSDAWPIPSVRNPEEPNDAVYPFWHDWVVDAQASVRTTTRGSAPNREYVVEWRNVASYEDLSTRMTFQAILHETGGYSFAYTDNDGTFLERGGGATIGIENPAGTAALQYIYRQPVLRPGLGIRINKPTA